MDVKEPWIAVSGYTKKTPYYNEAVALRDSAYRVGVEIQVTPFTAFPKWRLSGNYKPVLCNAALYRHPMRNIVWVDADARFVRYPELFDNLDADLAVFYAVDWPPGSGRAPCDNATLFLRNNEKVRVFVKEWMDLSRWEEKKSQQDIFARLLKDRYRAPEGVQPEAHQLSVLVLPATYCAKHVAEKDVEVCKPYVEGAGFLDKRVTEETVVIRQGWASRIYGYRVN